jgi:hypothetical protein
VELVLGRHNERGLTPAFSLFLICPKAVGGLCGDTDTIRISTQRPLARRTIRSPQHSGPAGPALSRQPEAVANVSVLVDNTSAQSNRVDVHRWIGAVGLVGDQSTVRTLEEFEELHDLARRAPDGSVRCAAARRGPGSIWIAQIELMIPSRPAAVWSRGRDSGSDGSFRNASAVCVVLTGSVSKSSPVP